MKHARYLIILLLVTASFVTIPLLKGCRDHGDGQGPTLPVEPTAVAAGETLPSAAQAQTLFLSLAKDMAPNAKAIGLAISVTNVETNKVVYAKSVQNPVFPVQYGFDVAAAPPCAYQVDVTATLVGKTVSAARTFDACEWTGGSMTLQVDTKQTFWVTGGLFDPAPASTTAGEALRVGCSLKDANVTAPDIAEYPIKVELWENSSLGGQFGATRSGQFNALGQSVAADFPDPYPVNAYLPGVVRQFACRIADQLGGYYMTNLNVPRISSTPTPTPTPTPTATPTPEPTATPQPTAQPGASGPTTPGAPPAAPTLTPTPNPCMVTTSVDNLGAGTLRTKLADVTCTTIPFAPSVTLITISGSTITVSRNVTIDGGSGVTIDGGGAKTPITVAAGKTVTMTGLTLQNGLASSAFNYGGGLYVSGGAIVTFTGTIKNNTAADVGGGVYNEGTLTLNGEVSGNVANGPNGGGGVMNGQGAKLTLNTVTVKNNSAPNGPGGGISDYQPVATTWVTITINASAIIENNSAKSGGGLGYANYGGANAVISGTIRNNTAANLGGGIHWRDKITFNPGHVIQGNTAGIAGGGWFLTSMFPPASVTGLPNGGTGNTPQRGCCDNACIYSNPPSTTGICPIP